MLTGYFFTQHCKVASVTGWALGLIAPVHPCCKGIADGAGLCESPLGPSILRVASSAFTISRKQALHTPCVTELSSIGARCPISRPHHAHCRITESPHPGDVPATNLDSEFQERNQELPTVAARFWRVLRSGDRGCGVMCSCIYREASCGGVASRYRVDLGGPSVNQLRAIRPET
jgi:hypothetical protein